MQAHSQHLRNMITDFVRETGSAWGQEILDNYSEFLSKFWLVKPKAAEITSLLDSLVHKAA
jgi:glutamate synthase (NADPH/NADH) large chain